MSSNTLSDSQRAIIAHCAQHEILHPRKTEFVCVVFAGRFIKYGNHLSLYPQYETHQYISRFADGDASAPRVPKVYDYFTPDRITAYLVMEYIELKPSPAQDPPQRVAKALQWLRDLPAPPDVTIDALERYMNKARNYIHPRARPDPVSFSGEQLVFTQSNMDERNFPDDMEGNTCLLGFEYVGLLPESFASYTSVSDLEQTIRQRGRRVLAMASPT
ncbi:hypothetical protein F5887DRAFT_1196118 [Amanita rubescens]|nr:hypothetical protein F5887DRAFT_1196118 [Amanita rubescens]